MSTKFKPDTIHALYTEAYPDWELCRDVYAGTRAIKARKGAGDRGYAGGKYLFPLKGQSEEQYADYRDRAQFTNYFRRTVQGLNGTIFRKDPVISVPVVMADHLNDLTQTGQSLALFAKALVRELFVVNRVGVYVDYPQTDDEGMTLEQAEAENLRPVWQICTAEEIADWAVEWIHNRYQVTRVNLVETGTAMKDGEPVDVDQRRILKLVNDADTGWNYQIEVWQSKENKTGKNEWQRTEGPITPLVNQKPIPFIPFLALNSNAIEFTPDTPPLLDLAHVNLSHYRNSADLQIGLHLCGNPTPFLSGFNVAADQEIVLGSSQVHSTNNPGATAFYLEFAGGGLSAIRESMRADEENMPKLGSRVLAPERRMVESAEAASIRQSGDTSVLANIAKTVSVALTHALEWHAYYLGIKDAEITCELNTDYSPTRMDAQTLASLIAAWKQGVFAYNDLFRLLVQGEIIAPDRTPEDIQAELEAEPKDMTGNYSALLASAIEMELPD